MDNQWWHDAFIAVMEWIVLLGTAIMAIAYGLRRVYTMARGVEKILEFTVTEKAEREKLAADLKAHIETQAVYRREYEHQIGEVVDTVREISRETRPNGGSSMKDVLNKTAAHLHQIDTRVAILETRSESRP